jgi:small subunit ribosomal protein S8
MFVILKLFLEIKNAFLSKKLKIIQQYSKQSINVLNILIKEGFIKNYKIKSKNKISIYLKYKQNKSVINNIKYLSKFGKFIYINNKNLYKKKKGFFLISTPLGLLTLSEVKKYKIGGKLICKFF